MASTCWRNSPPAIWTNACSSALRAASSFSLPQSFHTCPISARCGPADPRAGGRTVGPARGLAGDSSTRAAAPQPVAGRQPRERWPRPAGETLRRPSGPMPVARPCVRPRPFPCPSPSTPVRSRHAAALLILGPAEGLSDQLGDLLETVRHALLHLSRLLAGNLANDGLDLLAKLSAGHLDQCL